MKKVRPFIPKSTCQQAIKDLEDHAFTFGTVASLPVADQRRVDARLRMLDARAALLRLEGG